MDLSTLKDIGSVIGACVPAYAGLKRLKESLKDNQKNQLFDIIEYIPESPEILATDHLKRAKLESSINTHFGFGLDYQAVARLVEFEKFPENLRGYANNRNSLKYQQVTRDFVYSRNSGIGRILNPTDKRVKIAENIGIAIACIWAFVTAVVFILLNQMLIRKEWALLPEVLFGAMTSAAIFYFIYQAGSLVRSMRQMNRLITLGNSDV